MSVNNVQRPCRAYALMAQHSAIAVILRRGPSDWVQLIRWETDTDHIDYGQWFKGRVYERRCDLSPDGRLFLYFARKKNRKTLNDPEYTYAWTAVSKPPYFTALALWPKGNCWNGGGVFDDNTTLRLNHNPERLVPHPKHLPQGLTVIPAFERKGEDFSIYPAILQRHGWEHIQDGGSWLFKPPWSFTPRRPDIWRKFAPNGHGLSLLMNIHGSRDVTFGDNLILTYAVADEQNLQTYPIEKATWADWDQQGRLVYVSKGLLFERHFYPHACLPRVIADLNSQAPTGVKSPDWAKAWE